MSANVGGHIESFQRGLVYFPALLESGVELKRRENNLSRNKDAPIPRSVHAVGAFALRQF
jgi:uncharacterized protein (DUF427 family)